MYDIMKLMYKISGDRPKRSTGQFFKANRKPIVQKRPVLHTRPKQITARRG